VSGAEVQPQQALVVPERHDRHAFFAEVLGNGLVYSINYERIFAPYDLGLRVGASFLTTKISTDVGSGNLTIATFPIVLDYYFGWEHHKVQLGLGATLLYLSAATDSTGTRFGGLGFGMAGTAVVGYRYFPRTTGFTFAVGFTPLVRANHPFLPWGGASAGYVF
jgi:hypothetical protein